MSKLLKCKEHKEVFVIEGRNKHWIQNPDTFNYLGYKWNDVDDTIPFESLRDNYPVGPTKELVTVEKIIEGKKPKDIFYPQEATLPENPWKHVRGLLTLNPLPPSAKLIEDLGFNLLVPYAATTSGWKGDIITRSMRPGKVVARFTNDEPDCRKHSPLEELGLYNQMKKETPNIPIGTILCGDIGCGHEGTCDTKLEYKEEWLEVLNQMDFVMVDNYPYRPDWPNPLEKLEEFHQFYLENVTVPIIMIIQAHWGYHGDPTLTQPNPMEQVKFWVDRGYGYVAYPWKDELNGVVGMQEEWRRANEWAASQI